MENTIYYNISAKSIEGVTRFQISKIIGVALGITSVEGIKVLDTILTNQYLGPLTGFQYDTIEPYLNGLSYTEKKTVTQEKALYGDYPIDEHRLGMANEWYNKQTPEIQNFVDILIRNK